MDEVTIAYSKHFNIQAPAKTYSIKYPKKLTIMIY